jgi:hypothetical protein
VIDFAVVYDGDSLEAAVRMPPYAALTVRRLEVSWPGVIEQQERSELPPEALVVEDRANWKAVADPVGLSAAVNA